MHPSILAVILNTCPTVASSSVSSVIADLAEAGVLKPKQRTPIDTLESGLFTIEDTCGTIHAKLLNLMKCYLGFKFITRVVDYETYVPFLNDPK